MDSVQTIDFDPDVKGKQFGHLPVPCGEGDANAAQRHIPVCIIRGGEGPTVTLLAGLKTGQSIGTIALMQLARELSPDSLRGRVILLPLLDGDNVEPNTRAQAGAGDTNDPLHARFPGSATGDHQDRLAALCVEHFINPSSLVLELGSGGPALYFDALAGMYKQGTKAQQSGAEASMIAFGAPNSVRFTEPAPGDSLARVCLSAGKRLVTTRLGGGQVPDQPLLERTLHGCRNLLIAEGVLEAEFVLQATRMLRIPDERYRLISPCQGLASLARPIGHQVYRGDTLVCVIDPAQADNAPVEIKAPVDGILLAGVQGTWALPGDTVAVLADELPP